MGAETRVAAPLWRRWRLRLTESPRWLALRGLLREHPGRLAFVSVLAALSALTPTAYSLATGALVTLLTSIPGEGLNGFAARAIPWWVALLGALSVALQLLGALQSVAIDSLARRYMGGVYRAIMRAALRPATVLHFEDSYLQDLVVQARNDGWTGPRAAVTGLMGWATERVRGAAGATVAIVGDNGAGKTTLVKLLTRLYEPTAGRVLVDGTDLARIDAADWRARTSAGFQDFARFMTAAGQSVGLGQVAHVEDHAAVQAALGRAHASDVVATLPRGLDTQLGRHFKDGVGLSGGQWQKLALGRAMMRPAPVLMVLDEPTAALDAPSEHALFERYAGAAGRTAAAGGITLLISHRFSTVRMADLIVVVDKGRVVATGPHEVLIQQAGLYAELYTLQARAYQ